MQIFQENDRSYPAQVVAAQIRTLLYKHEGCTGLTTKSEIEKLFCEFWDLSVFVSHLDVTLTSSVGPECVELISIVCGVDLYCSESNLWCVFDLFVNTGE